MFIYNSTYKGYKIEVYPIETETGKTLFDLIVNEGYYGTCFDLVKVCETLDRLRSTIDKGQPIWDSIDSVQLEE